MVGGAYARDKNTSARLCAKNAGGAYAQRGAYLRDTTVQVNPPTPLQREKSKMLLSKVRHYGTNSYITGTYCTYE